MTKAEEKDAQKTVQPANNVASNESPLPEPKKEMEELRDEPVEKKSEAELTWKQKLEKGLPLNKFDEVKADADFNYKKNLREQTERKDFEQLKNRAKGNQ